MSISKHSILAVLTLLMIQTTGHAKDSDINLASVRQTIEEAEVQVKGEVTCGENETEAKTCSLKIDDVYTGNQFQLANAGAVMQYYVNGTKKVIVQGVLYGKKTISVKRAYPMAQ